MSTRGAPPNTTDLPLGYRLCGEVDLHEDRKVAAAIQVVFVLVAGALIGSAFLFDLRMTSSRSTGVTIALTIVACLVYMLVHELTHGAFLRVFSEVRPTFALRFPYLVTGSPAYLNKLSFLVVALAPAVVWGAVLLALLVVVPPQFFLTVFVIMVLNFAGSAGDYFQAYAFARLPVAALIRDDGTATTVYLPQT